MDSNSDIPDGNIMFITNSCSPTHCVTEMAYVLSKICTRNDDRNGCAII